MRATIRQASLPGYELGDTMTRAELTAALLAGSIERVREGTCPVCGKAFSAPHKRMTCGEAHCSRMIDYCDRQAVAEHQREHEEIILRRALQDVHHWVVNYGDGYFFSHDPVLGF